MIKVIFHLYNIVIIFFYLYPGSLLGLLINNDISNGPKIFPGFIFSLKHFFGFLFLSLIGLISYARHLKAIILYLILVSVFLEMFHLFIPSREFQFSDFFANLLGILIPILILILFNIWKRNFKDHT